MARDRLAKTVLQSLSFGLLFVPIPIAVLFALTVIEWWRYDNWSTGWMWEVGGFPCFGLFSIASASFFLHKTASCRFAVALVITGFGTIVCNVTGDILMITPQVHKSVNILWQRPEYLVWILVPPWIVAAALLAIRGMPDRDNP